MEDARFTQTNKSPWLSLHKNPHSAHLCTPSLPAHVTRRATPHPMHASPRLPKHGVQGGVHDSHTLPKHGVQGGVHDSHTLGPFDPHGLLEHTGSCLSCTLPHAFQVLCGLLPSAMLQLLALSCALSRADCPQLRCSTHPQIMCGPTPSCAAAPTPQLYGLTPKLCRCPCTCRCATLPLPVLQHPPP